MLKDELMNELPKGLLKWYHFRKGSRVLYFIDRNDVLKSIFTEKNMEMVCAKTYEITQIFVDKNRENFDYIVAVGVIERCKLPQKDIALWKQMLKSDGILLLGMDNRLGLRYFCGDKDSYTGNIFDSLDNYKRIMQWERDRMQGRAYTKYEIEKILCEGGIDGYKFYSVLPNLDFPQFIYAHDYEPVEELITRYIPMYNNPNTVFLDEGCLYRDLIDNKIFHAMANSYLIECPMNKEYMPVKHVTVSMDRGCNNALFTVIRSDGKVEKKAVYPEGQVKIEQLFKHSSDLRRHGLNVVDAVIENDILIMPYIDAEIATTYFKCLFHTDTEYFIKEIDRFRETILQSSEHVQEDQGDGMGVVLKRGYLDLVPLNCFVINRKYVFYDQEFCEENCPANIIIYRALVITYSVDSDMNRILPIEYFFKRYGLDKKIDLWNVKAREFLDNLRCQKELQVVYEQHAINSETIKMNRKRMNYSQDEYQKIFFDIFYGLENKKLIIFGSGDFARKFVKKYGQNYPIYAVIDNNEKRWGRSFAGIQILPPNNLMRFALNEYKVIICIKDYDAVIKQLNSMGIRDIGVYDGR